MKLQVLPNFGKSVLLYTQQGENALMWGKRTLFAKIPKLLSNPALEGLARTNTKSRNSATSHRVVLCELGPSGPGDLEPQWNEMSRLKHVNRLLGPCLPFAQPARPVPPSVMLQINPSTLTPLSLSLPLYSLPAYRLEAPLTLSDLEQIESQRGHPFEALLQSEPALMQ